MKLQLFSIKQPWASLILAGQIRFVYLGTKPSSDWLLVHAKPGIVPAYHFHFHQVTTALKKAKIKDRRKLRSNVILGMIEVVQDPDSVKHGADNPEMNYDEQELATHASDNGKRNHLYRVRQRWLFPSPIRCAAGPRQLQRPPEAILAAIEEQRALAKPERPARPVEPQKGGDPAKRRGSRKAGGIAFSRGYDTRRLDAIGKWTAAPGSGGLEITWKKPAGLNDVGLDLALRFCLPKVNGGYDPEPEVFELFDRFMSRKRELAEQWHQLIGDAVIDSPVLVIRRRGKGRRYEMALCCGFVGDEEHNYVSELDETTMTFGEFVV